MVHTQSSQLFSVKTLRAVRFFSLCLVGLEPTTHCILGRCSTNGATVVLLLRDSSRQRPPLVTDQKPLAPTHLPYKYTSNQRPPPQRDQRPAKRLEITTCLLNAHAQLHPQATRACSDGFQWQQQQQKEEKGP